MEKICVIGGGRWGQNHIKTLFEMGNLPESLKQMRQAKRAAAEISG